MNRALPSEHPVLQLIRARVGSQPGARTDSHRLVLVIEGGGCRATYSCGIAVAIDELGLLPCFDAVYGTSADAMIGAWLLGGHASIGLTKLWDPESVRAMRGLWRPLRGKPIVDTRGAVAAFRQLAPAGFKPVLENPPTLHPIATDAETGDSVDLWPLVFDEDTLELALRASATMPVLAGPPVELGGRRWARRKRPDIHRPTLGCEPRAGDPKPVRGRNATATQPPGERPRRPLPGQARAGDR